MQRLEIKGHSLYNVSGKDIVCAAVSSLVLSNIIYIDRNELGVIKIKQHDAYLNVQVLKDNEISQHILNCIVDGLLMIKKQFPNYINIDIC